MTTPYRVIRADAQAVIYEGEDYFNGYPKVIYGCARGHPRTSYLGPTPAFSSSGGAGTSRERLAGLIAAYEFTEAYGYGPEHTYSEVVVRNLLSGRVIHRSSVGALLQLAVNSDGDAAWTSGGYFYVGRPPEYKLTVADHSGVHLLSDDSQIAPYSLRFKGHRLYWTQGGKPMSAWLNWGISL